MNKILDCALTSHDQPVYQSVRCKTLMMRLLNARTLVDTEELKFQLFPDYDYIPRYAILSHRWEEDELTFQQACDPTRDGADFNLKGHQKVQDAARKAVEAGFEWIWCDTCCIDKLSSAELSEAINSMFRWYQKSKLCLVYLSDVSTGKITESKWFTRAWTLQELIAPAKLMFFNNEWEYICTKQDRLDELVDHTGIDAEILRDGATASRLRKYSVAQRMSWAARRKASRTEDVAYSLLGLFDVNIPMLYGERERAFIRLQEEIIKREADQTIFVWFPPESTPSTREITDSLFAPSPEAFARCSALSHPYRTRKPFAINNLGLEIEALLRPYELDSYIAYLPIKSSKTSKLSCLKLDFLPGTQLLVRSMASLQAPRENRGPQKVRTQRITIVRDQFLPSTNRKALYGFLLSESRHSLTLMNNWDFEQKWDSGCWTEWSSPDTYRFQIPEGATGSIAMLTLHIDEDVFFIQLAYDFDFAPCCNVTKQRADLQEQFRRRGGFNEDDRAKWVYDSEGWDDKIRYVDKSDPENKSWMAKAKSLDFDGFKADVPVTITKSLKRPLFQISISFFKEQLPDDPDLSSAWRFQIGSNLPVSDVVMDETTVSIVDVRDNQADEDMTASVEGRPATESLKRPSAFATGDIERLSKRIDTYPL